MTDVRYEAEARRLRLVGAVVDADLDGLKEAVDAFRELADGHLVLDLTAVTGLADPAARYLIDAKAAAEAQGRRMTLLRKLGTPADHALNAAAERAVSAGAEASSRRRGTSSPGRAR